MHGIHAQEDLGEGIVRVAGREVELSDSIHGKGAEIDVGLAVVE